MSSTSTTENITFADPNMKTNIANAMMDSTNKITYNEETWNQVVMIYQGSANFSNPIMINNGNIRRIEITNDLDLRAQVISIQFKDDSMKVSDLIVMNDTYLIISMRQNSVVQEKTKKANEKTNPTHYTRYFCY